MGMDPQGDEGTSPHGVEAPCRPGTESPGRDGAEGATETRPLADRASCRLRSTAIRPRSVKSPRRCGDEGPWRHGDRSLHPLRDASPCRQGPVERRRHAAMALSGRIPVSGRLLASAATRACVGPSPGRPGVNAIRRPGDPASRGLVASSPDRLGAAAAGLRGDMALSPLGLARLPALAPPRIPASAERQQGGLGAGQGA
jgi:hypothetical protein